jgi:hypothetical protein
MKPRYAKVTHAAVLALVFGCIVQRAPGQAVSAKGAAAVHGSAIDASPSPVAASVAKTQTPSYTSVGGQPYRNVDFQLLAAYPFNAPNDKLTAPGAIAEVEKQIPASIKALEGKKVMIRGFLVPIKDVQGRSTEFLIVRDQPTCCYSGMTAITEFVSVKVPGKGVPSIIDQPVIVQGTLHVGAVMESGYVLGVYTMDGEKLADPPKG